MRGVWGVAAAVLTAALSVDDRVALAQPVEGSAAAQRFMLFTGADMWRNGGFAHAGLLWAFNGLDDDGPVLKLATGGGLYRYHSGALGNREVTGYKLDAVVLPGWRFRKDNHFITVFAGLDWQRHKLLPDDPATGLRGGYAGLRAAAEWWHQPTTTTMIAGDAAAASIGPSYSGRIAFGWRVFDLFYIGPEMAGFTANGNYRQYRAGLHATGWKFSRFNRTYLEWLNFEWSGGLGLARDSDHRQSVYVRLGLLIKQ
jgi:hypothetical protein